MAPRPRKTKTEAVPRGKPKPKEKLKRIPTVLKIKLPLTSLTRTVENINPYTSNLLNKKAKDLTQKDKLELTNAVARSQLNKSEPLFPPETRQGVKVVKKRVRKRKVEVAETNNQEESEVTETNNERGEETSTSHELSSPKPTCPNTEVKEETTPESKPQPKRRGRKPKIKTEKEVSAETPMAVLDTELSAKPPEPKAKGRPLKRKLVNPTEGNQKPRQKRWKQTSLTGLKILVRRTSKASSSGEKPRTVTMAKPKIIRKRASGRGKKNVETVDKSPIASPILTENEIGNYPIKKEDEDYKYPDAIVSRKTSVTSELSWTKDISDSSNTTSMMAVTSSDFVLIDRKLPEMRLTKIDSLAEYKQVAKELSSKLAEEPSKNSELTSKTPELTPKTPELTPKTPELTPKTPELTPKTPSDSSSSSSDSSDSSDSESETSCNSDKGTDIVSRHSLNLSMSSESHRSPIITQKNININNMNSNVTRISRALDKLSMSLKKIDLEMINWVGHQNEDINTNGKRVSDKILQHLKEESNIIVQCRHINKILSDNEERNEKNNTENVETNSNEPFVKPSDVILPKTNKSLTNDHSNFDKGNHSKEQIDYNDAKYDLKDQFTSDNIPYTSLDQFNDDEDALSLYAESIGLESNRNSISSPPLFNHEIEEYIPQPVVKTMPTKTIVYNPTKISNNQSTETVPNVKAATIVCEKQNADSTSVVREAIQDMNRVEGIEKLPEPKLIRPINVQENAEPCLLASIFKPVPGIKSVVFKGMCFFHLVGGCKNQPRCRFPHIEPSTIDIHAKLVRLSEDLFIQEYLLLKCWPGLRRNYGKCFVDECKRRDLTRLLVEMALDFVMKANPNSQEDNLLKIHVMEEALLYLNNIDLNTCANLLKYAIHGKQLCDLFMETIANTQNFTRFKPVFVKLTEFMIENNKPFNVDVASHILERVAILPFNESLAWALISIIKHTEAVIFENSMMQQFEKQLASNERLHTEFLAVKEVAGLNQPATNQIYMVAPLVRQDVERPMTSPLYPDGVQRYNPSPDTTHLDNMSKPPDEPVVTRNINFDRIFPTHSSSSSESTEDHPRTPKPNSLFNSWRNKTIFKKFNPNRYTQKRRMERQVTYGGSPSKFPRRPGPDFF